MNKERVLNYLRNRSINTLNDCIKYPIALSTVSGVATTKTQLVKWADDTLDALKLITTKSYQVLPNSGNREPIICELSNGSYGNSVGLRNPGMEIAIKELSELRKHNLRCFLVVSVSASCIEDFVTLIKTFDSVADIIELNFSCPHASKGFGSSIGSSCDISSTFVKEIRIAYPQQESALFIKLTPNVDNIGEIAKSVIDSGADGITAINTVGPDMHINNLSNTPILQNKLGGKGGKSGTWIKQDAIECVKSIRQSIGDNIPIIAMGGVSNGLDAYNLIKSGGDAIGIGSAFGKVHQKVWKEYLNAFVSETNLLCKGLFYKELSSKYYDNKPAMNYKKIIVSKANYFDDETTILEFKTNSNCRAGEFVFLWLPQVGEKPFSVAKTEPLTFIIKRRGKVSNVICDLKVGDEIYLRGLYGAPIKHDIKPNSIICCGGTGVAVAPLVCKEVVGKSNITTYVGLTGKKKRVVDLFEEELKSYGKYICVYDDGKVGRVLETLPENWDNETNLYLIGPTIFMELAAKKAVANGLDKSNIYMSMEKNTMCGIGMCGECAVKDRLSCQWGTFFKYDYLEKENVL